MLPAHIGGIVQHKSTNRVKKSLLKKVIARGNIRKEKCNEEPSKPHDLLDFRFNPLPLLPFHIPGNPLTLSKLSSLSS
jgi:hypothetical protein